MSELPPEPRDHYDRLDDTGQFSASEIHNQLDPVLGAEAARRMINSSESKSPHRNPDHRGGRAYPQPSDSSLDPNWNTPQEVISDDQHDINAKGAALSRHIADFAARPEIKQLAKEDRNAAIDREVTDWNNRNNFNL